MHFHIAGKSQLQDVYKYLKTELKQHICSLRENHVTQTNVGNSLMIKVD